MPYKGLQMSHASWWKALPHHLLMSEYGEVIDKLEMCNNNVLLLTKHKCNVNKQATC